MPFFLTVDINYKITDIDKKKCLELIKHSTFFLLNAHIVLSLVTHNKKNTNSF